MNVYPYDIETYPNVFTLAAKHSVSGQRYLFEISNRRDDRTALIQWLNWLHYNRCRMVGFNNVGFDYPVVDFILRNPGVTAYDIYQKAASIIHGERFGHIIWEPYVEQIDLFKIHHFDNKARATSLKAIEFNMRMGNIADLPFEPGSILTSEQIDELIVYNHDDVDATDLFHKETIPLIEFREKLTEKYDKNFINHNDTKIGKDYFITELEKALPGCCYGPNRQIKQTFRHSINMQDVVFPWIQFKRPEFQAIKKWFQSQIITETKGVFNDIPESNLGELINYCTVHPKKRVAKNLHTIVDGFRFDFGTGGIHGSVPSCTVCSDDHHDIIDVDVTSYYPSLAIVNRVYPLHLGELFCDIYTRVFNDRRQYPKGTPENAALKLALNGVYGDSNNPYSPFYDPQYTMTITINGQLLLCLLADYLMDIPGLQMIQANTDGLTVKCPKVYGYWFDEILKWWEGHTGLGLERANYSRIFIRDVNNYIAEYADSGKLKRKGAYEYELGWHQDHSALVIPKAAEAALVRGVPVDQFIRQHDNIMDFMLRAKVPRSSRLMIDDRRVQNITRYFVSQQGGSLVKVMPPLPKAPDKERSIGITVGWKVTECNRMRHIDRSEINFDYYIQEANKLVEPCL